MERTAYTKADADNVGVVTRWLAGAVHSRELVLNQSRFERAGQETMNFQGYMWTGKDEAFCRLYLYRVENALGTFFSVLYKLPENSSTKRIVDACLHQHQFVIDPSPKWWTEQRDNSHAFQKFLKEMPENFQEHHFRTEAH